jgi:FlaA1/EpsC-like NDP-sugar epimerase
VLVIQPLVALLLLGGVRAAWRMLAERRESVAPQARRLLIVGTLHDAADALRALKGSQQWVPVGILSPLAAEKGRRLQNVPVLGTATMVSIAAQATGAHTALIASPAGSVERTEVLLNAGDAGVTLLTMPRPDEWLKTETAGPRKIELEDLLGRSSVQLDAAGSLRNDVRVRLSWSRAREAL